MLIFGIMLLSCNKQQNDQHNISLSDKSISPYSCNYGLEYFERQINFIDSELKNRKTIKVNIDIPRDSGKAWQLIKDCDDCWINTIRYNRKVVKKDEYFFDSKIKKIECKYFYIINENINSFNQFKSDEITDYYDPEYISIVASMDSIKKTKTFLIKNYREEILNLTEQLDNIGHVPDYQR